MAISNVLLLLSAGINIGMSAALFFRSGRSKSAFFLSFVLFFAALWSFSMFCFRASADPFVLEASFFGTYLFGGLVAYWLFVFVVSFPYWIGTRSRKIELIIYSVFLAVSLLAIFSQLSESLHVTHFEYWSAPTADMNYFLPFYVILSLLFLRTMVVLTQRLIKSEGIHRDRIMWALIGVVFSFLVGSIFDVAFAVFWNFKLNWLGPVSSLLMNFILLKLLFTR